MRLFSCSLEDAMGKKFRVLYWGENEETPTECKMAHIDVTIPDETMAILTSGRKPPFYRFLVKDGQQLFVPSNLIINILEVW